MLWFWTELADIVSAHAVRLFNYTRPRLRGAGPFDQRWVDPGLHSLPIITGRSDTQREALDPPRVRHRRDIQGLRGLAVLVVVLYHAGLPVPGGFIGVDVFFVISGFVIGNLLINELRSTGRINLRRFYARRVRRLLPALMLMLTVVLLIAIFVLSPFGPQQVAGRTALAAAMFSANLYIYQGTGNYFADASKGNPLLHTWSLSVEEQFYFLFPALLLVTWLGATRLARRRGATNVLGIVLATIAIFSLILSVLARLGPRPAGFTSESIRSFAFYASPFRVWEFVAGALLVVAIRRLTQLSPFATQVLALAGFALILFSAFAYSNLTVIPGIAATVPVAGATMLIAAGSSSHRSLISFPLCSRPATFIGDLSYSWYLWHWPAIVMVQTFWPDAGWVLIPTALLSLIPAWMSYKFVETPIRNRPTWPPRHTLALVAASVAVPLALAGVLTVGASRTWGMAIGADFAEHRLARNGCTDTSIGSFPETQCTWKVANPKGTILLLGDSHATSLSDGAVAAGNALSYDVAVWARSACPFLARPTFGLSDCADFQQQALALALAKASLVVIANRSTAYTLPSVGDGSTQRPWRTISTANGSKAASADSALTSWSQGLDGVLEPLGQAGIPVVVFATVPEYPNDFSRQVSLLHQVPSSIEMSRHYVSKRRNSVLRVEAQVVARHPHSMVFDPVDLLCDSARCSPVRGEGFIYMDSFHLNPKGSKILAPALQGAFAEAIAPR